MGETAAETLKEIEASRARIERDLTALDARLPDREVVVKRAQQAGVAAAGAAGGLTVGVLVLRRRWRHRAEERELERHVQLLADKLATLREGGDPPLPEPPSRFGAGPLLALLVALVVVALSLLQLRRVSRRNVDGSPEEAPQGPASPTARVRQPRRSPTAAS